MDVDRASLQRLLQGLFSDFYRDYMSRINEAEERVKTEEEMKTRRKKEIRRPSRAQLGLPAYDSFDEDFDFSEANASGNEEQRSQLRSPLGIPDYDSFVEDF